MNINVLIIPHSEHRYPTVGDWWFDENGTLQIRVSKMDNWKYELLVAIHEQIEAALCHAKGITSKEIDEFDMRFEKMREAYPEIVKDDEPGDNVHAPYHNEHGYATSIEMNLSQQLLVDWALYNETINKLE